MHAGVAEVDAIDRASRDGVRAKIAFGLVATFGGHHLDQSGAALGRLRRGAEQRVADGGYAAGLLGIAGGHGHPVDPSAGLEASVDNAVAVLHAVSAFARRVISRLERRQSEHRRWPGPALPRQWSGVPSRSWSPVLHWHRLYFMDFPFTAMRVVIARDTD